ncbi:MAG: hypothetical protein EBU90_14690 [Proteobacteria bacterium]|jgi:hypothetical protein|nr:hypothetical protein [Pseudomonadota bacterium]
MNNSNYPPGAENDPSAPYNQPEYSMCPYCEEHMIREYIDNHIDELCEKQQLGEFDPNSKEYEMLYDKIYKDLEKDLTLTLCSDCRFLDYDKDYD